MARLILTSAKSAELIKHASNAFLALKISFVNAVSSVCEAVGADVEQVCEGIGSDSFVRIASSVLRRTARHRAERCASRRQRRSSRGRSGLGPIRGKSSIQGRPILQVFFPNARQNIRFLAEKKESPFF